MAHTNAEEERRDVKHTGELLCAPCVGEASRNAHASRHRGRCAEALQHPRPRHRVLAVPVEVDRLPLPVGAVPRQPRLDADHPAQLERDTPRAPQPGVGRVGHAVDHRKVGPVGAVRLDRPVAVGGRL